MSLRGTLTAPVVPMAVATNPSSKINRLGIPSAPEARSKVLSPVDVMPSAPTIQRALPIPPATQNFGNIAAARAMQNAEDPGSPFSAFAQGWTNATAERELLEAGAAEKIAAEAEAKAIRDTTAEMLADHPDLARLVQINGMQPEAALQRKEQRDKAAAELAQSQSEAELAAQEIQENAAYARSKGFHEKADLYERGIIDIDGLAAAFVTPTNTDRPIRDDANGTPRFVDNGDEVYPGVAAQPAAKPLTDAQRKANSLLTVVQPDADLLLGDGSTENPGIFNDLGDGGSQLWNGVGLSPLVSGDFQAAKDAVTNIAQSYLYAMSGAAAPAEEVKKIADLVTPNPGDSAQRKDEKRRRLQSYIDAIASSTVSSPMTSNDANLPSSVPDLTTLSDEELLQQLGM